MGKRRYIKFFGRCQVIKIEKIGKEAIVNMRCPRNKKIKVTLAQELLDEINSTGGKNGSI